MIGELVPMTPVQDANLDGDRWRYCRIRRRAILVSVNLNRLGIGCCRCGRLNCNCAFGLISADIFVSRIPHMVDRLSGCGGRSQVRKQRQPSSNNGCHRTPLDPEPVWPPVHQFLLPLTGEQSYGAKFAGRALERRSVDDQLWPPTPPPCARGLESRTAYG